MVILKGCRYVEAPQYNLHLLSGFGETAEFDENESFTFPQGVLAAISPWEEMVLGMKGLGTEPSVSWGFPSAQWSP